MRLDFMIDGDERYFRLVGKVLYGAGWQRERPALYPGQRRFVSAAVCGYLVQVTLLNGRSELHDYINRCRSGNAKSLASSRVGKSLAPY